MLALRRPPITAERYSLAKINRYLSQATLLEKRIFTMRRAIRVSLGSQLLDSVPFKETFQFHRIFTQAVHESVMRNEFSNAEEKRQSKFSLSLSLSEVSIVLFRYPASGEVTGTLRPR